MSKESIRLLFVEDDPDDVVLLRDLLRTAMPQTHFDLVCVASVSEALAHFHERLDLFIFDYRIGAETGIDLLREMKRRGIQTPAILLTGQGGEEVAVEALKAGATDYLPKARLSETSIRLAVRYAINLHRKENLLRRAHEALRASEERFRALVENSADVMTLLDRDGTVLYTGQSLQHALGYRPSDNVGTSIMERIHPDDIDSARQILQASLKDPGKVFAAEVRVRHQDGSWRLMEGAICNRLHEPAIGAIVLNGRDITERKRIDEELRRSERHYRMLFESANDAILVFEPEKEIILEANQKACEVYGFERSELIGRSLRTLSQNVQRGTAEVEKVLRQGGNRDFETVHCRRDGTPIHILANSRLIDYRGRKAIFTINHDVTERRKAEQALRASEARYRNLVETANEGIWTLDAEDRTVFVNARMTELLGYSAADLTGRQIYEFLPEGAGSEMRPSLQALRSGARRNTETWLQRKDGSQIYAVISSSPIFDCDGNYAGAVAMFTDLTERKAVEQERERLLWELKERIKETTCLYTITNYIQICDTIPQMLQCSAAALAGAMQYRDDAHARIVLDGDEFTDPEFQPLNCRIAVDLTVAGEPCGFVEAGYASDGSCLSDEECFLKEERDLVQAIARTLSNAIEHKRAEEALRASEERYRSLFERNLAGVFRASLEGELLECNAAFRKVMGYEQQAELVGTSLCHLSMDSHTCETTFSTLRSEGQVLNAELQFRRRNGTPATVLMNVGLLRDAAGEPIGLEGTLLDVTETYKLREQLLQSQKMDAVGQLAGGVAHDFNNLLMIITGYCEMLANSLVEERQQRQLDQVLKASRRGADLTRQLLAFSRKQVMAPQILDLNATVRDLGKMLPRLIGENIQVEFALTGELDRTKADPTQMQQVLMNLSVNARDAMPNGGRLSIETANVELDERYVASHVGFSPGRYVMLAVSDSGTGIDPAVLPRIFEPFFTTKERGKGAGLGLSTVYGIVQQSGGQIYVYSEPGRGTTFKIYLPCAEPGAAIVPIDATAESEMRGSETILLVEDEQGLRDAAAEFLAGQGYLILQARDGEDALKIAEQYEGGIDLLLTDVIMPGPMSGPDLARRVGELRPETRVLYMSGYTEAAILQQGVLDLASQLLQKPFSFRVLSRKIRQTLEHRKVAASA